MQPGNFSDAAVRNLSSRVLIDGVVRPHESWSIQRDIPSDLPAQAVGYHGITQATGEIVWASQESVNQFATNPWNPSTGWTPEPGQRVQIIVRDEQTGDEWVQFTGRIDDGNGQILSSQRSTIIDDFDDLSVEVSHDALLRIMPPSTEAGENRRVGLVSTYHVDYAMRQAGFYCTPRQEPECALLVPAQGGVWPHRGTVMTGDTWSASDPGFGHAENHAAPWGLAVSNFRMVYAPHIAMSASNPVQISFMIAPTHTGYFHVVCEFGTDSLSLVANGRTIVAYRNQGTQTEICRLTSSQMDGATIVSLVVKSGSATLRNNLGTEVSGTSWTSTRALSRIRVAGDHDARVAGIQVNRPPEHAEHRPSQATLNARIGTATFEHVGTLWATPAIEKRTAESLLSEISRATLSAMWIDEHGVLNWTPSVSLRRRAVVDRVTTLDDITSLSWRRSLLGSRSKITVKLRDPRITQARRPTVLVHEGGNRSIEQGETIEDIITPGDDEAWVGVDTDYTWVGYPNWEILNGGVGTFLGRMFTVQGEEVGPGGTDMSVSMAKIGPAAWKITHELRTLPAGTIAYLKTSDTDERLWHANRGAPLPRVQAYAKVQFEEDEIIPVGVGGVGPELVHDCDVWVQSTTSAENLATYLQSETARSRITITGLRVLYDPRRQLGDRIRIDSPDLMGVTLDAVVFSITNDAAAQDGYSQTLGVTVFGATTTFQTYAAFNAAGGRLSYQQWNALSPQSQTYQDWDAATDQD